MSNQLQLHGLFMIPLVGGPCSLKTKTIKFLRRELDRLDDVVSYDIAEAATELHESGHTLERLGREWYQIFIANHQIAAEEKCRLMIGKERPTRKKRVVLLDRGILDGAAYLDGRDPLKAFEGLLAHEGVDFDLTIDDVYARYAAVIHLVTAADGAEEFYTTADNEARTEKSLVAARRFDRRIQMAWRNHPDLRVVRNVTDSGGKVSEEMKKRMVLDHVLDVIGVSSQHQARFA